MFIEKALNSNFRTAGKSKEVFTHENPYITSDLDFFEGNGLAIDGQSDYDIASIALDIEHSKQILSLDNSTVNSASKLVGDLVGELTGVSDGLVCNPDLNLEHCATETVLERAVHKTTTLLQEFSQQDNLETKLEEVFGEGSNIELAQEIFQDIAQEDSLSLPTIGVLDSEALEGADGAYAESTETIYLSQGFLTDNQNSPDKVTQVLIEEFGHYLDAQINETDTPGDEGAIFADVFNLDLPLSAEELATMSVEDDSSKIIVDNQLLSVENNSNSTPLPSLQSGEDGRLGTKFRTEGIPIFDSNNDVDGDGLNDEWENIALNYLNPSLVFDEDEDLFDADNSRDKLINYTRITPTTSKDGSQYVLFMHAFAFSNDYGALFGISAHDGDTESAQVAWEVTDDFTIQLRSLRTRGHKSIGSIPIGIGDPIATELRDIEISSKGSIKIYIEENKHGTFPSKEKCESTGPYDCGEGRQFPAEAINVGEPPEVGEVIVDQVFEFPGEFVWSDAGSEAFIDRGGDDNFIGDRASYIGRWLENDIKAETISELNIG